MKFSIIVVYSSIDEFCWPTLRTMCDQATDDLIAVRRTHLWGGDPEPLPSLGCNTLTLPAADSNGFAAAVEMRMAGIEAAMHEWVLLLDSDEIPESDKLLAFQVRHPTYLPCHYYWRTTGYRMVQQNEVAGLLAPKSLIRRPAKGDREAMCQRIERPRFEPWMHHLSWCKPIEAMRKKVRNWGHCDDRDWLRDLEQCWASPLPGRNFVHPKRPIVHCKPPGFL